ncbi:MAG: Hpt domain-containing protein [Acidobacteria bacterium]|nr:Hpt domain-containing protein [Acidobacteriota bacterium]
MESPASIVRVERFRELAPSGNAAVLQLVELFLGQMREQLEKLREAIGRESLPDVELLAHRLAGTSATCGADSVSRPLVELERAAKSGTLAGAAQHLAAAVTAFARTEDFLLGYVAGLSERQHG